MPPTTEDTLAFFFELDALKTVQRKSYIQRGARPENSAEHSWHLAMACWNLAESLQLDVDINKLIKLALVHDLGEIGAGDTFLYSPERSDAHIKEREFIETLQAHPGNSISNMLALWDEQESGSSPETQLLKVVDRILPLQLNLESEGIAWRENHVHKDQVLQMNGFIADEFPALWEWVKGQVDYAVAKGWLRDDELPVD